SLALTLLGNARRLFTLRLDRRSDTRCLRSPPSPRAAASPIVAAPMLCRRIADPSGAPPPPLAPVPAPASPLCRGRNPRYSGFHGPAAPRGPPAVLAGAPPPLHHSPAAQPAAARSVHLPGAPPRRAPRYVPPRPACPPHPPPAP